MSKFTENKSYIKIKFKIRRYPQAESTFRERTPSPLPKNLIVVYDRILLSLCFLIHYLLRKWGEAVQFDSDAVGRTVRRLRTKKKLSQDVLSGLAGIARTHLTMIENGKKQANFETLWKIANALNLRASELVALIEAEMEQNP